MSIPKLDTRIKTSESSHQGGLYLKPKHLLILSHSDRLLNRSAQEFSAEHKKQRGWQVTGAIVDVPTEFVGADHRVTLQGRVYYGDNYVVNNAADLKAVLEAVKPNAILAHEYAINHPEKGQFTEFDQIADEARRIRPYIPYVVEAEKYSRLESLMDHNKDLPILAKGSDGHSDAVVEHRGYPYAASYKSMHAYLKSGVDAQRKNDLTVV